MSQAQTALMDSLKIAPSSPFALQALARLSMDQGNPADAKIYGEELVRSYPTDSVDRQLLAEAWMRLGRFREADEQITVAKQLSPNDPAIRVDSAQIYAGEKKMKEADDEFNRASSLAPHNATVISQYADFLAARKQSAEAQARGAAVHCGEPLRMRTAR